jgi:hypothetical protein
MQSKTITRLTVSAFVILGYVLLVALTLWCLHVLAAPAAGFHAVVVYVLQGIVLTAFFWGALSWIQLADSAFDIVDTLSVGSETQASTEKKGGNNEIH